ncbi:major facilitator superfamily domain-containing protein [Phthorimaea operculella]|nr:major facilitator superfamily domain-containing protein [Phthorimaea operculella]
MTDEAVPVNLGEEEYEQAFEKTGHGRFNCLATLSCSLIFIHSIIEMVAFAYVITPARCDLHLTTAQNSAIGASVFIGILITAICWGVLGDLYGRKKTMLPAIISSIITSFASSFCVEFWSMLVLRFLTGLAVSSSSAMVLVYLAELQTNSYRDRHVSIAIGASQFSFFFLTGLAWSLIPQKWVLQMGTLKIRSWRVFMWIWGLVGLTGVAILVFLPESPRYIVAVKGPAKALPILAKIYAWNHRCKPDEYPVKTIDVSKVPHHNINLKRDLKQLLQSPMRRCIYLTHAAMFMTYLLNNGFYIWHTDIMNAALKFHNKPMSLCHLIKEQYGKKQDIKNEESMFHSEIWSFQTAFDRTNNAIFPLAAVTGTTFLKSCTEASNDWSNHSYYAFYYANSKKDASRPSVIISMCCLGLLLSSCVPQMTVSFCFLVMGLACGSCCSILTAMVVEAFPTSLRGLATCTMYMIGQIGAVVGTSVISLMVGWACHLVIAFIVVSFIGSAAALLKLWPDPLKVRGIMEQKGFTY